MEDRLFTSAVVTLVFLSFVMGTSEFIVVGILPDMARDLGVEYTRIGGLVSVFALGYAVFTPVITGITGRFSRFRVLMALAAVFLASDLLTLVSWDYWSLAASRVLTAASSGALLSVGITFVMDLVTPRYRAKAVSWVFAGFSISSVFGVPLGTAMSHALGWRSVFVLILVMGVAGIALASRTMPRTQSVPPGSGKRSGSAGLLRDPRILLGCSVTVFGAAGIYVIYTYISPILEDCIGFPDDAVSIGLMVFGAMLLVSNLVSGVIAEHGGLRTIRYTYLIQAAAMLVLPTALASSAAGMADLLIVAVMMYFMNASVQVHLLEMANRDYPSSITLASSLNPTSFNIGITIGSLMGGLIYDGFGAEFLGYGAGIVVLFASASAFMLCALCKRSGKGSSVT